MLRGPDSRDALLNLSKDNKISKLTAILNKRSSEFHLVDFLKLNCQKNLRSAHYREYEILCHLHSLKHAGWLVCRFALKGGCSFSSALLSFNAAKGVTGRYKVHIESHKKSDSEVILFILVSSTEDLKYLKRECFDKN